MNDVDSSLITLSPTYTDKQLSSLNPSIVKGVISIIADQTKFVRFDRKHPSKSILHFSIVDSIYLNDFGINNICWSFPNLISLYLHNSISITNRSLQIIVVNLKRLNYLQISSCKNIILHPTLASQKYNPLPYLLKN